MMRGNFKPAEVNLYIEWLRGHLARGGKPRYYRDKPFAKSGILMVTGTFGLDGEAGARAKKIIVVDGGVLDPKRAKFGHNTLYYTEDFKAVDRNGDNLFIAEIFNDQVFLSLKGVASFIAAEKARERKKPVRYKDNRK